MVRTVFTSPDASHKSRAMVLNVSNEEVSHHKAHDVTFVYRRYARYRYSLANVSNSIIENDVLQVKSAKGNTMSPPSSSGESNDNSKISRNVTKSTQNWKSNASLLFLLVQQATLVLLIRYSKQRTEYLSSTVVFSAEVFKLVMNGALHFLFHSKSEGNGGSATTIKTPSVSWLRGGPSFHLLFFPALAYVIQNNLLFVALANLSVPVYQVTNQGKLLTTAFFSTLFFNRKLYWRHYLNLAALAFGVALVQINSVASSKAAAAVATNPGPSSSLIGLLAVAGSCFTSGAAGVYFEKLLKKSNKDGNQPKISVYQRNCQLAAWSIALGVITLFRNNASDWKHVLEHGFFHGYTTIVWIVVMCQAITGLCVAWALAYADAIYKGLATSGAVVLATTISMILWPAETQVTAKFVVGVVFVLTSVQGYSRADKHYKKLQQEKDASANSPHDEEAGHLSQNSKKKNLAFTRCPKMLLMLFLIGILLKQKLKSLTIYSHHPQIGETIAQSYTSKVTQNDNPPPKTVQANDALNYNSTIPDRREALPTNPPLTTVQQHFFANQTRESLVIPQQEVQINPSTNQSMNFTTPNNIVLSLGGCPGGGRKRRVKVNYLRSKSDLAMRMPNRNCTNSIDTIAWILDDPVIQEAGMITAYGELIHILREGDFVKADGKYFDDDIDTWGTPQTLKRAVELESYMWEHFGWSLRIFENCRGHSLFVQIFAACGHHYNTTFDKIYSNLPAIEMYVLGSPSSPTDSKQDLWHGTILPDNLLFPIERRNFHSNGSTHNGTVLKLQLPAQHERILECFYGNWTVPSKKHAERGKNQGCFYKALKALKDDSTKPDTKEATPTQSPF